MRKRSLGRTAVAVGAVIAATAAVLALPAYAGASTADDKAAAAKLTPALESKFAKEGTSDFWVRFSDKADLEPAKSIKDWTKRGQYVVDALEKTAKASQAGTVAELDTTKVTYKTYSISNAILVKNAPESLALKLAASPEVAMVHETATVKMVEPVKKEAATETPQGIEWGLNFIHAPEAWAQGATGAGITVAAVDSGAQYDHPALVNQYRGNNHDGTFSADYNWYDAYGYCDGEPCDPDGHGTHTMGTMVGDDGAGNQIGVAPDATWIETNGCCTTDEGILDSGWWLLQPTDHNGQNPDVSKRPQVINNSWGWDGVGHIDSFFDDVNTAWNAAGQFAAWASGNPGSMCQGTSSPGANTLTYSVGAVDSSGTVAYFSGRGAGQNGEIKPNIAAPGVNVRSSVPGGYANYDGTSMATPHVAGAVAALWSYNPSLIGNVDETRRLLDESATDVDDTTCGGTAADNNVYGEGYLDLERLISLAPNDGGTLSGTVTSGGDPVAGATVVVDGSILDRTLTTDADGTFSADVNVGDYTLTASGFGLVSKTASATVTKDSTTTVDFDLAASPKFTLSGTVTNSATNAPVAGAKVSISPGNLSATSGADGTYSIAGVPAGTYTVSTAGSGCAGPTSAEVDVAKDKTYDVKVVFSYDAAGHYCTEGSDGVRHGDTALGLEADDGDASVALPFSFPFYGHDYSTAYVTSNGFLNLLGANHSFTNGAIPSAAAPNAAIYPFWDDLDSRGAGDVYTSTTTIDGVDAFVIEWRDVFPLGASDQLLDFSATLFADGRVELGYGDLPDAGRALGNSATVGIENETGTIASQFSNNTASLTDNLSVTYDVAPMGTLSGTVKDYNTKAGIDGAEVTLTPLAGGDPITVKTAADGTYSADLVVGKYQVSFASGEYETVSRNVTITEDTTLASNAQLKAGRLAVTQTALTANLAMGGSVSRNLKIANTGSAPAEVSLGAAGEDVVLAGDQSAAATGVTKGVTRSATTVKTAPGQKSSAGTGLRSSGSSGTLGSHLDRTATAIAPTPAGEVTLSHSTSHEVQDASSVACPSGVTTILRTYTPADFGITGSFTPSSVSFAIQETATGTAPVTAKLYTLPAGAAFTFANLVEIGSGSTTVTGDFGSTYTVPVTASTQIAPDDTLVVAVSGTQVYFGGNAAAETSPTYIASDGCGTPDPTDAADLGFPDSNIILDVTGSAGGGSGVSWLDVQPPSFTLAPGASVTAVVAFDAAVDQPGTYTADVVVGEDTPYDTTPVPATMTVKVPAGWGKITGTVTGDGEPLEGAVVHLDGISYDVTVRTAADGTYAYWMQKSNGPLQVIVAADGYVPATKKAQIVAGQTTVYDFDLDKL